MNADQADRLRGLLSARNPGARVEVVPDADGARIFLAYQGGGYLHLTTGDQPGMVLRSMLGADLRAVDDTDTEAEGAS